MANTMIRFSLALGTIAILLAACTTAPENTTASSVMIAGQTPDVTASHEPVVIEGDYTYPFHDVPVIEEYAGLTNPVEANDASIKRGKEAYLLYCAVCHGETGHADGPAAVGLDPPVAALAETQALLADDFLYFRIRDGGVYAPFNSAMPAWEEILKTGTIWDLINYIRTFEQ
jgi:mono/diheme cytochrome c family protein